MIERILSLAAAHPEGFTVSLPDLQPVTHGIVVAYLATQNSFDAAGLARCLEHAESHDGLVGGWLEEETGRYYFDSCRLFTDLQAAKAWGREQRQLAIFDLTEGQVHPL